MIRIQIWLSLVFEKPLSYIEKFGLRVSLYFPLDFVNQPAMPYPSSELAIPCHARAFSFKNI